MTRWRALLRRASFERHMSDEMRFHLESRIDDLVRRGVAPDEARRQARLEFGNPAAWQDECRESRQLHLVDDCVADIRFALRGFRRHALLTAVVIVTLTFGIGIASGVLTMFARLALHPPVQTDPGSFVKVHTTSTMDRARPRPFAAASVEEYLALRDGLRTVRTLAAVGSFTARFAPDAASARPIRLVTCDVFDVYGPERARLGRLLQPDDCDSAAPVVVLSHTGWLVEFGGDNSVVGRTVSIAGLPCTIVGVAPPSDATLGRGFAWLPYTLRARLKLGEDPRAETGGHRGHDRWLTLSGRMAGGATREAVAAEAALVLAREDGRHPGRVSAVAVTDGALVHDPLARSTVLSLVALVMGALSCLVLIACANVATLLLSRADARQAEIAVRLSLGAGRWRLMRMLLTETVVLACSAGAASVWVAYQVPRVMMLWLAGTPSETPMTPDWHVFAYIAATIGLAGVAAGMAPALESLRVDLLDSLKGRRSKPGAAGGSRFRSILVGVQVALGFVLMVGASLFLVTHYKTINRQVGFETAQVLMPRAVYPQPATATSPSPAALLDVLQRLPGTRSIAFAATSPVFGAPAIDVVMDGGAAESVPANEVSPQFFDTIDLPILRGRALAAGDAPCDRGSCPAVVSESFARQILQTSDPIGRSVMTGTGVMLDVVGMAADTSVGELNRADRPAIYLPWTADGRPYQALVRFEGRAARYAPEAAAALRARFPGAVVDTHTLRWPLDVWRDDVGRLETLIVALGGAAVTLAAIGVFGVVSFTVARRRHELGVRVALGAARRHIYMTVIGAGLRPAAAGLACGVLIAVPAVMASGDIFRRLHIEATATDPLLYLAAAVTLSVIIIAALWFPARTASRVDPLVALRSE